MDVVSFYFRPNCLGSQNFDGYLFLTLIHSELELPSEVFPEVKVLKSFITERLQNLFFGEWVSRYM